MTGLPRLALDAHAKDNQLTLISVFFQLSRTVPNDGLTRTIIQASYAMAILVAPVAFQVLALYLWTRPLAPRARRAAALALRILFAWCGIEVFLCLLVCMFLLPLKHQLVTEISTSKGCGPIEPLMRAYFGAALAMQSDEDHCIGFNHTFHPGIGQVAAALAVQYALAFFVLGASEMVDEEENCGRGGGARGGRMCLRSIVAVADAAPRGVRPPPSPAAWAPDEDLEGGTRGPDEKF
jgi:hypothetical protein